MTDAQQLKKDLWKRISDSPFLMVSLSGSGGEPLTAQLDKDQVDTLWFFIGRTNRLAAGGSAFAQFVSKGHDFFASLAGNITIDNDRGMIDKLWSNKVEAWFPKGKTDPDLALLRFDIADAELRFQKREQHRQHQQVEVADPMRDRNQHQRAQRGVRLCLLRCS